MRNTGALAIAVMMALLSPVEAKTLSVVVRATVDKQRGEQCLQLHLGFQTDAAGFHGSDIPKIRSDNPKIRMGPLNRHGLVPKCSEIERLFLIRSLRGILVNESDRSDPTSTPLSYLNLGYLNLDYLNAYQLPPVLELTIDKPALGTGDCVRISSRLPLGESYLYKGHKTFGNIVDGEPATKSVIWTEESLAGNLSEIKESFRKGEWIRLRNCIAIENKAARQEILSLRDKLEDVDLLSADSFLNFSK